MPISITHFKEREDESCLTVVFLENWDKQLKNLSQKKENTKHIEEMAMKPDDILEEDPVTKYRSLIFNELDRLTQKKTYILEVIEAELKGHDLFFLIHLKDQTHYFKVGLSLDTFLNLIVIGTLEKRSKALNLFEFRIHLNTTSQKKPEEPPSKKSIKLSTLSLSNMPFLFLGSFGGHDYFVDPQSNGLKSVSNDILYCSEDEIKHLRKR